MAALASILVVPAASCGGGAGAPDRGDAGTTPAEVSVRGIVGADERAVTLRTTACGDASGTVGTGVVVGQAVVLTAAHVVVGATDVFVDGEPATVFLLDRTRDLALIKAPSVDAPPVELTDVEAGDAVRVVGGATSGTVDASVVRRLVMDVDDVRSTSRSTRTGYELDAAIAGGDSGAGVFDGDGRLAGVVFAFPSARSDATFVVDASEIRTVLESPAIGEHRCDPSRSQLLAPGG